MASIEKERGYLQLFWKVDQRINYCKILPYSVEVLVTISARKQLLINNNITKYVLLLINN